jgi:hypothetical protein
MQVIRQDELPFSNIAREFVGADHGAEVSLVHEGEGVLRMTSAQPSPSFSTEWKD